MYDNKQWVQDAEYVRVISNIPEKPKYFSNLSSFLLCFIYLGLMAFDIAYMFINYYYCLLLQLLLLILLMNNNNY